MRIGQHNEFMVSVPSRSSDLGLVLSEQGHFVLALLNLALTWACSRFLAALI
jgi:hypothetical protein